jgi:prepilin-type N-terminal cleavage/methylation domain-containing protein
MGENNFISLKRKQRKGLTLVELIIAVTVLAIAVAGTVTIFHVGFDASRRANDVTIASIEAQLWMERMVGLTLTQMLAEMKAVHDPADWGAVFPSHGNVGDYGILITHGNAPDVDALLNDILRQITVYVYRPGELNTGTAANPENWIFRHGNILNVDPTGSIM